MTIEGSIFTEKAGAGAAILAACKAKTQPESSPLGSYRGFAMSLAYEGREFVVVLQGALSHKVTLGTDIHGNLTRIDNALNGFSTALEATRAQLANTHQQVENAQKEVDTPFKFEDELKQKAARLDELNAQLNMDEKGGEILDSGPEPNEPGSPDRNIDKER